MESREGGRNDGGSGGRRKNNGNRKGRRNDGGEKERGRKNKTVRKNK